MMAVAVSLINDTWPLVHSANVTSDGKAEDSNGNDAPAYIYLSEA